MPSLHLPALLGLAIGVCLFTGCLPATKVIKNPSDCDRGVRYYRPKPYLFISAHETKDESIEEGFVDITMEMLPDFSEEYAIHIRTGLGQNKTSVTLEDGWNLTALNVDIDSNFDENFKAVTDGVSKIVPTSLSNPNNVAANRKTKVRAHNVPLGYYESVISKDSCGHKRLYGWRYIGFTPYTQCPIESSGVDCQPCHQTEVYGLVFEDGAMVFKPLYVLKDRDTTPVEKDENP